MYASQPAQKPVTAASRASAETSAPSASPSSGAPSPWASEAAVRKIVPTRFAKRGGRASSKRPLAEDRLNELEVDDAGQAEAPPEREPDRELSGKDGEQPPPARRHGERGEDPHRRLIEARPARVDHVKVAIGVSSALVPVKSHSEQPRSPATQWRSSP